MSRALLTTLLALLALGTAGCALKDEDEPDRPAPLGSSGDTPKEKGSATIEPRLDFPVVATKNTLRVGGADPAADAAGVARMVFPATSSASRPKAVVLVDAKDWQGAVSAAVMMARPVVAPLLLSDGAGLPPSTDATLARLDPPGNDLLSDAQVLRIGESTPRPRGRKGAVIRGDDPYERAAAVDRAFATAAGETSDDVIVTTGEKAEFAMPAAAWAARSGDAVLFARRRSLPSATRRALEAHRKPDIFLLGPESVVGKSVERELDKLGKVTRISGVTPVQNAIEFARFRGSGFGWGIKQPGQNFTLARTSRPADAAAAAALATKGTFAPLLLTDSAARLPELLENYFLDLQPGYNSNPNEGVFNRVVLLGDESAISLRAQGRLDEITELVPVQARKP